MISAITALMNRESSFERMLPSWAKEEHITDFIVVDWASEKPIIENKIVKNQMDKFNKIKIIRVENEKHFHIGLAFNLASQYTNKFDKILLKLDADYVNLDASWINCLRLKDKSLDNYFISGSNKFYIGSSGFLLVNKEHFGQGYNENMLPIWGGEDSDLIEKLSEITIDFSYQPFAGGGQVRSPKLKHIIFFDIQKYIYHINHSNKDRAINYTNYKDLLIEGEVSSEKLMRQALQNVNIGITQPKWKSQEYEKIEEIGNYIRVRKNINILNKI